MLAKIRHMYYRNTFRTIYFSIFESHLIYCCTIWGQRGNPSVDRLISLQNTAILCIMTFSNNRISSKPLYKELKILQFRQQVSLQNILFVNATLNKITPFSFSNTFVLQDDAHNYATMALKAHWHFSTSRHFFTSFRHFFTSFRHFFTSFLTLPHFI